MRDKHGEGIKEMCFTVIRFGRSKLLQSSSNVTLKSELEVTVIACLTSSDAQNVLYTGIVQAPSGDLRRLRFLPDICNANIYKTAFSAKKKYTILNEPPNG